MEEQISKHGINFTSLPSKGFYVKTVLFSRTTVFQPLRKTLNKNIQNDNIMLGVIFYLVIYFQFRRVSSIIF